MEPCSPENMRAMNKGMSRHVRKAMVGDSRASSPRRTWTIFRERYGPLIRRLGYEVRWGEGRETFLLDQGERDAGRDRGAAQDGQLLAQVPPQRVYDLEWVRGETPASGSRVPGVDLGPAASPTERFITSTTSIRPNCAPSRRFRPGQSQSSGTRTTPSSPVLLRPGPADGRRTRAASGPGRRHDRQRRSTILTCWPSGRGMGVRTGPRAGKKDRRAVRPLRGPAR